MKSMRWHPAGYGGTRRDPDQVKRDGWHDEGVLAVSLFLPGFVINQDDV